MRHTDRRSLPCSFAKQSICLFCLKGADVEDVAGKLRSQRRATRAGERVSLHHHCAYFASGLAMRDDGSEDRDTICGFHVSDIINEAKRGAKLRCSVCGKSGATIGCVDEKCQAKYHFPCATKAQAMHLYCGSFPTYCRAHRPAQNLKKRAKELLAFDLETNPPGKPDHSTRHDGRGKHETSRSSGKEKAIETSAERLNAILAELSCPVCLEGLKDCYMDSLTVVHGGCCRKSFFHRTCIQAYASSAGYFFCCPLCKDQKKICDELRQYGIEIPERDAAWELEADAFNELYQRHSRCDASKCFYPAGRNESIDYHAKWDHIICSTCGWKGTHRFCSALDKKAEKEIEKWQCEECAELWSRKSEDEVSDADPKSNEPEEREQRPPRTPRSERRRVSRVSSSQDAASRSTSVGSPSIPSSCRRKRLPQPNLLAEVSSSSSNAPATCDANNNTIDHLDVHKTRNDDHERGSHPATSFCASPTHSVCSRSSVVTRSTDLSETLTNERETRSRRCAWLRDRRNTVGHKPTKCSRQVAIPEDSPNPINTPVTRSRLLRSAAKRSYVDSEDTMTDDDAVANRRQKRTRRAASKTPSRALGSQDPFVYEDESTQRSTASVMSLRSMSSVTSSQLAARENRATTSAAFKDDDSQNCEFRSIDASLVHTQAD